MRAIRTFGLQQLVVLGCVVVLAIAYGRTAVATNYLLDPNFSGADGSAGEGYPVVYKSITSALNGTTGVPAGASAANPNVLYIEPGIYNTAATTGVSLSYSKNNVALIGLTGNADDVVITSTLDSVYNPGSGALGTTGSATLQLKGNNVSAKNITFANSTDTPYIIAAGHQHAVTPTGDYTTGTAQTATQPAVALLLQGDQQAFQNVKVLGYQDTLYMKGGRVYFNNSYVSGDDDFMFANGTVVFKNSTINIDGDHSGGAMTAARDRKSVV
jgi:pectinesterase